MRRVVVLAVAVLGVAAMQSPARANNEGAISFQGRANVGTGLSSFCAGSTVPDLTKCPLPGRTGNSAAFSFAGTGAGYVQKINKPKCSAFCFEQGTYSISATGSIRGWCELWTGTMWGTITPSLSLGTKANTRNFTVGMSAEGGNVVITGTTSQGETVIGRATWVPDSSSGSSCLNKGAKSFIVVGELHLVR